MLPITKQISKFNYSSGNNIKYIVIHYTGNINDTAMNNAKYFSVERNASAHYFIDNTSIVQVVEDHNKSWHCGDGKGKYGISNSNSIGIEMCGTDNGRISATTINNTIELVKMLMKKYNVSIDNVVRHYDASRKNCPSAFSSNNWARWYEFKKLITQNTETNITNNQGDDDMISDSVKVFATLNSPIANQMKENIKVLQGVYKLPQDGIATEKLVKSLLELNGTETKGIVTIMQKILILKGMLSKGSDTGVIGDSCRNGINRFKEGVAIPTNTKLVDRQTWRKLLEY